MFDLIEFAQKSRTIASPHRPYQMDSLATLSQYRTAYEKTSQYLNGRKNVLDWGCGNGHFSLFLLDQKLQVTGYSYENYPECLRMGNGFQFVPGVSGDPSTLPFPDESFEVVFSIGVIEHVHELKGDQRKSIQEIFRVLKPGGIFFVFHLPSHYSWIEFIVRLINKPFKLGIYSHSRRYTEKTFLSLFEGLNYRVLEQGRYNTFPRNTFNRLPSWINQSAFIVRLLNKLDDILGSVFPALCQNWFFIIEKK